jgi:hypothetical protein
MKYLRVIDHVGNKQDVECSHVPRIGELVMMTYGSGGEKVRPHWFRVKDVLHNFDNKPDGQVAILLGDDVEFDWPT